MKEKDFENTWFQKKSVLMGFTLPGTEKQDKIFQVWPTETTLHFVFIIVSALRLLASEYDRLVVNASYMQSLLFCVLMNLAFNPRGYPPLLLFHGVKWRKDDSSRPPSCLSKIAPNSTCF